MKKAVLLFLLLPIFSWGAKDFQWNLKAGASNRVENEESFIVTSFKPYIKFKKFYGALDLEFAFDSDGAIEQEDWDNVRAATEKIAYLGYSEKGDGPAFFRFGMLTDVTLGQGILVNHFRNDAYYPIRKKIGLHAGFDFGYTGFEGFLEDTFDMDLMGGRLLIRPLYGIDIAPLPEQFKRFEIGISFVMDTDPLDQDTGANGELYLTKDSDASETVRAYAVDMLVPIYDNKDVFSIASYVQYGDLQNIGAGTGFGITGKVLGFMDYKLEALYLWDGFVNSYFSSFYGVREIRSTRYTTAENSKNGWGFLSGFYFNLFDSQLRFGLELLDNPGEKPFFYFYSYLKPTLISRLYIKMNYHRKDVTGLVDMFNVAEGLNTTAILLELGYEITTNATISIRYVRGYKEENGVTSSSSTTEVQTNLLF